jgi:hypothetical protein
LLLSRPVVFWGLSSTLLLVLLGTVTYPDAGFPISARI